MKFTDKQEEELLRDAAGICVREKYRTSFLNLDPYTVALILTILPMVIFLLFQQMLPDGAGGIEMVVAFTLSLVIYLLTNRANKKLLNTELDLLKKEGLHIKGRP